MITIDADRAIELLRQVVEGREDYVYDQDGSRSSWAICRYVGTGGDCPDCLIGHVLHLAGVPLDLLAAHEGAAINDDRLLAALTAAGFTITLQAAVILAEAQTAQDHQYTWGNALAEAEDVYVLRSGGES